MTPIERARLSLEGLSVGDAFGERFFGPDELVTMLVQARAEPGRIWRYTDDTEMAISIVEVLERRGAIDQDALGEAFARRMDPARGYGAGAYRILQGIRNGRSWRSESYANFRGCGSFGNGGAMRVAPLGAAGYVRDGIDEAIGLPADTPTDRAAHSLGNGAGVTAPDTVPFCLWAASWFSHDFVEAMWQTVSALGDRDTTCAIVGGIVSLQVGHAGIPDEWRTAREALP
jgi:ADP-ribosylglycohydrolase